MSILGIDYGTRRIGVAVSESGVLATPHSVVPNEGNVVDALAKLANDLDATTIVVGLPRRPSGDSEKKFRDFAAMLRKRTGKDVVLWDETLTTVDAAERLRAAGRNRREAQRDIDKAAAAVILQSYLDEQRGRS